MIGFSVNIITSVIIINNISCISISIGIYWRRGRCLRCRLSVFLRGVCHPITTYGIITIIMIIVIFICIVITIGIIMISSSRIHHGYSTGERISSTL